MTAFSDLHCCVEEENYNADGVDWHDHLKFPRNIIFQIICSLIISKVDQPSNQDQSSWTHPHSSTALWLTWLDSRTSHSRPHPCWTKYFHLTNKIMMVMMNMNPPGMGPPLPAHSFSIVRTGGIRPGTISSVSMRETNNHSFQTQSQMFRTPLYLALVDLA